jgi:hypothetical protein
MAQPQSVLSVDADDNGLITIKEGGGIAQKINISSLQDKFKALCAAAHNNNLLSTQLNALIQEELETFELLNENINRADSIKDGTNINTLTNLGLFPEAGWSLSDLKDIIHGIKDHCIGTNIIERITFTRTKASGGNDASGNWGLDTKLFRIGYDAGLGLDTLFPSPMYDYTKILIETFGKYIDPSTGGRDAPISFPNKGTQLVLNERLFAKFGYLGNAACYLPKATNMGSDRYDYEIKLVNMDQSIINNGTIDRLNDGNITKFFGGNASKKVLLAQGNATTLIKKQVIVGKGLGDKLQVIILWIRSQIQMKASGLNGNTGIATCDEVVALLCIILQLPFFLTSTSRDRDNVKIDEVLFYNPGGRDAGVAKKRYAEEYRKVLKSYVEMIKLIRELPSTATNRGIPVIASGGGMVVLPIPLDFCLAMITDLSGISDWIRENYVETNLPVGASDIYGKMSELKKLTSRQIFKLNKTGTICQFVRTAKGYTCAEPKDVLLPEIFNRTNLKAFMVNKGVTDDISKRTFYELFMRIPTMGGAKLHGGMPVKAAGGPASTQGSSIPPFFSCEEVQEPNDPLYYEDVNPEKIIDGYPIRYKQSEFVYIDPILAAIKPDDPIGMEEIKVNDEPAGAAAMDTSDAVSEAGSEAGSEGDAAALAPSSPSATTAVVSPGLLPLPIGTSVLGVVTPGAAAGAGVMETGADALSVVGSESGEQENDTWKKPNNSRPNGIFDANASLRIELYDMYSDIVLPGNWRKNDDINISFWEVLNECMEVFVYDPRYDSRSLFDLIFNFKQSLYQTELGTGTGAGAATSSDAAGAGSDDDSNPKNIESLERASQMITTGEMDVAPTGATIMLKTFKPDVSDAWNKRLQRLANATTAANAKDMGPKKRVRSDLGLEYESDIASTAGGSRRSTRRRKYRKTLKNTRRKKTGKQSSRTTRSKRRRRNKKRRNITRKN